MTDYTYHLRCTRAECEQWRRSARAEGRTLADVIRAGLNARVRQRCTCEPGKPICPKCAAPVEDDADRLDRIAGAGGDLGEVAKIVRKLLGRKRL